MTLKKPLQVKKYIIGKKLKRYQKNGKFYHCVTPDWRWKIEGAETSLDGFKSEYDAIAFMNNL